MQRLGSVDKRAMEDSDEIFWKSLMSSNKTPKKSKKDKKRKKLKNLDANVKKKSRKINEKKKEKKKKKEKLDLNPSPNFTHTQPGQSFMMEETKRKTKKKVAFDLSPFYIYARHPEVLTLSALGCEEKVQPADSDSQWDNVNSQDLFITQKTFRASPSDPSSEEVKTPPQLRTVRGKVQTPKKNPQRAKRTSTATQTENFFTSELSSFLHFQQSLSVACDDVQPLDLSLPHRSRSGTGQTRIRRDRIHGHQVAFKSDEESIPSNESQPEVKSVNTPASSDDGESTGRSGRADLSQFRAVQMRLNESFFFKTKGGTHPRRPESPLMKLSQGRDGKKTRKKN